MCVTTEAVGAVLRHPPLLPKGDRGGELRKEALRALLPRSFLRTGGRLSLTEERTHVRGNLWMKSN